MKFDGGLLRFHEAYDELATKHLQNNNRTISG